MTTTTTHYLTLDLVDDPLLIAEYEAYHKNVWPEVKSDQSKIPFAFD